MPKPVEVFISYSHKDEKLKDRLVEHLSLLKRQGYINVWHDRVIKAGQNWSSAIDTALDNSELVLCLVSPSFIGSDYCYGVEMQRALDNHRTGQTTVIPIILRPVDWTHSPLGDLQALPAGGRPVVDWETRDQAFYEISSSIRSMLEPKSKPDLAAIREPASKNVSICRVVIADDHEIFRQGLRSIIANRHDLELVGEASTGLEAVDLARRLKPDIVIMDIVMPELDGLGATRQIRTEFPTIEILVLTMDESEELIRDLLDAGARGYMLKTDAICDLLSGLDALRFHRPYLSGRIAEKVLNEYLREGRIVGRTRESS